MRTPVSRRAASIISVIRGPAPSRGVCVSRSEGSVPMRTLLMTKSMRAAGLFGVTLLSSVLVPLQGCTDLDETPASAITPSNFYRNEAEVLSGLAGVYAQL